MKTNDILLHLKGESLFTADMANGMERYHIGIAVSTFAHAKIISINSDVAEKIEGVISVITAKDIPGKNQIGNIIEDEQLLADTEAHYVGQPIALVVATTPEIARRAVSLIQISYEELVPIFDPREASEKNSLIAPPRIFSLGDIDSSWKDCDIIVEGRVDTGGQEHLYLETQNSFAIPKEGGGVKIYSSTQSPTAVQRTTAQVLGVAMHQVEVETIRLGGGFGGKEDQATPYAIMTALVATLLQVPAQLILTREEDLAYTGKRHPYSSDFKIGATKDGKILAYDVRFYQNSGAAADLSTAILERTLLHTTGSYCIPNVKAYAVPCKTNLPPNTAYRGFGGPQAMFVIESAIRELSKKSGISIREIQRKNLLQKGDEFPYGMKNLSNNAVNCFNASDEKYGIETIYADVKKWNETHLLEKRGVAIMPLCFGISFTSTFLNQASALVHVYTDGSVGISTGVVEMGQSVHLKLREIASKIFSIPIEKIKMETTNTTRNANTSPTAASSGADLNGNAVKMACDEIVARLKTFVAKKFEAKEADVEIVNETVLVNGNLTDWNWEKLIWSAYFERNSLSAQAFYATPNIFFDKTKEKGNAFAYHVFGTAIVETTVDCLRGEYKIDSVKIIHDVGQSLHETVDRGQIEGALLQGLGWVTMEELVHNKKGKLLSKDLSSYKIPDIYFAPDEVAIDFLKSSDSTAGPFNSKAIGEPPFMYGIAGYFALMDAIKAFNPNWQEKYDSPMTPEKTLLALYSKET